MTEPQELEARQQALLAREGERERRRRDGWDRALAGALALPALLVAWPGPLAPVGRDLVTTGLTATGLAACAAAPAALLLALRGWLGLRVAWRPAWPALALVAAALLSSSLATVHDPLERTRTLLWIATGALMALGGAQLGAAGRLALARAAAGVAALLVVPALWSRGGGFAGVLHNTGELSNAALVGAGAAAALFARERGGWRQLGAAVLVLFLLHALLAPSLTGLVALAAGCALPALVLARAQRDAAVRLSVVGALALLALGWVAGGMPLPRSIVPRPEQSGATAVADDGGDLGGVEVRRLVALSTLELIADHALVGVGPGQFVVAFPPYRDPAEIELSSPGRGSGVETEVEHPHDDHLALPAELGLAGALVWLALVLLVLRASWRAARAAEPGALALATGAVALLVSALALAPFSDNAVASTLGFASFGALLGAGREARRAAAALPARRLAARVFAGVTALAYVALACPAGARLVRHGLALAGFAGEEGARTVDVRRGVEDALAAAPDSVLALSFRAQLLEQGGASHEELLAAWEQVLARRPHRLEALVKLGVLHARAGELDAARAPFEQAAALDPGHPSVLRNRVRLELESGQLERGLLLLDELQRRGGATPLWLRDLGAKLLCRGLEREAQPVLALADERFADLTAEEAYELSNHYRADGAPLAGDGFRALADLLWARGHAADGRFGDARRLYRQCLRTTRGYVVGGAPRVRMELAASMVHTDRMHEAEDELLGLEPGPTDWAALPGWARAALGELGHGPDAAPAGQ